MGGILIFVIVDCESGGWAGLCTINVAENIVANEQGLELKFLG